VRHFAGARCSVRLDSRQPILHQVLMRRIGLAVVFTLSFTLTPMDDGLTTPAFLCARLIRKFKLGESVQAIDTLTDRFHGSEYSTTPLTPHRIR
jgi:hypothetical protein